MTSKIGKNNCSNMFVWGIIIPVIVLMIIEDVISTSSQTCPVSSRPTEDKKYYKGAVVEFAPDRWNQMEKAQELILRNAKRYVNIIKEAGKEKTDIIVFPEAGLTTVDIPINREKMIQFATFIPEVEHKVVLCDDSSDEIAKHLKEVSCAAIEHNIYVVINLLEKVNCDKNERGCPADGLLMYNTNIVFDRKGVIIAKYHKFNLFVEPETNITSTVQLVTFDTDFGVRFGMFICFDILFNEPAIKILEETGVKNIVYSTAWFSELPHLTAVETQSGYSYSRNVNFLASGYNRPELYNTGSGIFAGERGPLVMVMSEEGATKLLIAKIPADPENPQHDKKCNENDLYCGMLTTRVIDFNEYDKLNKLLFYTDKNLRDSGMNFYQEDLSKFTTQVLNDNSLVDSKNRNSRVSKFKYNRNGFNCEITAKWEKDKNSKGNGPFYRFIGYSGKRSYVGICTVSLEVCSLIACKDKELSSCGLRPNFDKHDLTNITSVHINIQSESNSNPYVVTLNKYILPLSSDEISFSKQLETDKAGVKLAMILEKPQNDLITFGIYKT